MDAMDFLAGMGMNEEDLMTMVFDNNVADLREDTFDGSEEERKIFEEIFGGGQNNSQPSASKTSSAPSGSASSGKMVYCRIVESFTHGNLSSYHVFDHSASQQMQNAMPCTDHDRPSELMVQSTPPSIDGVYTRRAVTHNHSSQRAQLSGVLDLERVDITSVITRRPGGCGFAMLWNHLRLHAHLLMMDAGWRIEGKERGNKSKIEGKAMGNKSKIDLMYESPDKLMRLASLARAWKCFGEWLLLRSSRVDGGDCGKEWSNMHDFLCDLKNTMLCLEHEARRPEQSLSFMHQWRLLDPFMAVVCIEKKVAALRNGVALKAVNSRVYSPQS
ncbi:hypothetical protein D1007_37355 [Hordeum vulgare]|uniref:uncharacterized protein LOC123430294 n=1 Tax=Hordeum vulgare subsp. vulgare TaxID=112509 RepID=UPI00162B886D|nr:uncharacterized protein LOC123430294 [Hordeum vulgare subsp. vulgare]KAE8788537.1 hypothetical protein D1007_37355 [Hordeum vulgare]KAI5015166.1 hypothetical protein ZWY2020_056556 [Hordeum vulgare]